jgi:hypothetical protein
MIFNHSISVTYVPFNYKNYDWLVFNTRLIILFYLTSNWSVSPKCSSVPRWRNKYGPVTGPTPFLILHFYNFKIISSWKFVLPSAGRGRNNFHYLQKYKIHYLLIHNSPLCFILGYVILFLFKILSFWHVSLKFSFFTTLFIFDKKVSIFRPLKLLTKFLIFEQHYIVNIYGRFGKKLDFRTFSRFSKNFSFSTCFIIDLTFWHILFLSKFQFFPFIASLSSDKFKNLWFWQLFCKVYTVCPKKLWFVLKLTNSLNIFWPLTL